MKRSKIYAATMSMAVALGLTLASCEDDKEMYQISELPTQSTLASDVNNVVISNDNLGNVVATFTYSASAAEISCEGTSFGEGSYWLEYSLDENFTADKSNNIGLTPEPGNNMYKFTGLALNSAAVKVNAKYDVPSDVFFRIVHSYNNKSKELGVASNVVKISVTPIEVPTISIVSKTDINVVYATLQINAETSRFEGIYPDAEMKKKWEDDENKWNFYFVDTKAGIVYGCDDAWTGGSDGVTRSCKLVAGREVGDGYSHWFDPAAVGDGVKFWVDLSSMEWGFGDGTTEPIEPEEQEIVELKEDQLGIRGNGDWDNPSNATDPIITDDVYTYTIENIKITDEFKFFCNDKWIGVGDITTLSENFMGDGNLSLDAGTYTLIVVAKKTDDGFTYESATAIKDALGIRGNGDWDNTSNIVAPSVSGSEYTYTINNVVIASEFKFFSNGNWIGVKDIETLGTGFEGTDNLSLAPGTYTLTIVANAAENGSLTFKSVDAELTAAAQKKDLSNVYLGIKGNGKNWDDLQNSVTPEKNGDVYTYVINGVEINGPFKFVYENNWLGINNFVQKSDIFSGTDNLELPTDKKYNFTVVLTANEDGTVTATSLTAEVVE